MLLNPNIVDKLGGSRKLAAALDRSESTIWRWLNISFPGDNLDAVRDLCRKRGITANLDEIVAAGRPDPHKARKSKPRQGGAAIRRLPSGGRPRRLSGEAGRP